MRNHICTVGAVLVFLGTTLAAWSQNSAPPIKMGQWQTTNIATINGFQLPPDVAARLKAMGKPVPFGQPQTTVVQSCVTREKWENMFSDMQRDRDCRFTNRHQTSAGMSADLACKSADGQHSSTGHIEMSFQGAEKIHGKAHIETVESSQPRPIVIDMNFDGVYQGPDCHGVSPDSAKIIR